MNAMTVVAAPLAYADLERLGASIAKSGLFGIKTPDQAIALMMIAQAEGRHPALAARDYDIIQGRPAKKAEAMLRDFYEGGGKMRWHTLTDDKADATFTHPQSGDVRITWDIARANKAGLASKENWKRYPRQMLRSRVISEGIRTAWPVATSGLYVPEEVRDFAGATIEGEAEPAVERREEINREVPLKAAATAMPEAPLKRQTLREWMTEFDAHCAAAQTPEEASKVLDAANVMADFLSTRPSAMAQYEAIRSACIARLWPEPSDDLPEVEIRGEANVSAG